VPWAKEEDFLELKKKFKDLQIEVKPTITNLHIPKHELIGLLNDLKQMGYKLFVDHSVVDFPERSPRFQAFYILYNVDERKRVVVKTWTDGTLPSIEKLWFAGKWAERECYDMFGIKYEGTKTWCVPLCGKLISIIHSGRTFPWKVMPTNTFRPSMKSCGVITYRGS
jgi:NADH dehydrogenase subunit C (EC 1.6.5.3)/NADH dehydrogenase subunit D (EC 1.6.5.3)